jgi:hypothetical protein
MDKKKVVVRKLPPNVAERDVIDLVDKSAGGKYSWFKFVQGKSRYERKLELAMSSMALSCSDTQTLSC